MPGDTQGGGLHPGGSDAGRRLESRYMALRKEIAAGLLKADSEQYGQLAGEVGDIAEHSVADLLVDLDLAEIHRDLEELRNVELALQRFKCGSYGICMDCGEQIAEKRLKSLVSAVRCVKCQSLLEGRRAEGISHSL
jgi:DnaK suppressor protein